MKLLVTADLHITNKRPQNRKDDYFETCMNKFEQILDIARREEVEGILVAGDFFDSPTVPYFVTKRVIELINDYYTALYVVPGQHDLRYHTSGLDNTPMGMLLTSGKVYLLHPDTKYNIRNTTIVGAGWNEEPSTEGDILVMHRMITMDGALFAGQDESEYTTGHQLLHKYKWAKCIITGDNHQRFRVVSGSDGNGLNSDGRVLYNCGSMMRSSKSQVNYCPVVRLIDTDHWTFDSTEELNIKPSEEVFNFEKMDREELFQEEKKRASEDIAYFVKSLETTEENKPDFKSVLQQVVAQVNPGNKVENIINKVMEEVENG